MGHPYHYPELHPGPCSSVGIRPRTDTQIHRQTDTQTRVTTIHFASSTTHAKCNGHCKAGNAVVSVLTYKSRTTAYLKSVLSSSYSNLPYKSEAKQKGPEHTPSLPNDQSEINRRWSRSDATH